MRRAGLAALAVLAVLGAVWFLVPREPVALAPRIDAAAIEADPAGHLARQEARFDDIVPGTRKRILWQGEPGTRAPLAVVYIHGFSGTSEELRPLPDAVAEALGAHLVFTRLAGHGRDGAAMAEPAAGDWMDDTAEALAVARAIADETLLIATSTGGTLAALALLDPSLAAQVRGVVLVSPNFGVANRLAALLTWPGVRVWGPLVAGQERGFEPLNEAHARYWTERYPLVATLPMAALVDHALGQDFGQAETPALIVYSEADTVVRPDRIEDLAAEWGGQVRTVTVDPGPGIDPNAHILAGDILSPAMTAPLARQIVDWAQGLPPADGAGR